MKNRTRRFVAIMLIIVSMLTVFTTAFAKSDSGGGAKTSSSSTSTKSGTTTKPTSSSGGANNNSGSSGNNYGSSRPPMKEAYEALTNTSKGNGTTYGNPGVWSNGSGPGSSSSSSTSSGKKSSSSGSPQTTTQTNPPPTRTPRPSRDDDDDDDYTPPVTPDLAVTNITPASYRGNSTVMSTVTVQGLQNASVNGVEVRFDAAGAVQTKTVNVPASSKATVLFTWIAPSSGPVTLTATINPAQTVTETDYTNNTYSRSVTIQPPFIDAQEQPDPVPIPARPGGENNDYVTWEETENGVTTTYWARLTLTATPSVSQLKSGYGFGVTVSANVTTNYHTSFAPSQVVMFIPERGYNGVVRLVNNSGTWMLPVSPYSPIGAQKWYVPVWFPDATTYSANITAVGASTPGGELTATIPVNIFVDSNMYTDDSTNNTWAR